MLHWYSPPVKIFVLGNGTLLDEGISNILVDQSQLSVTRVLYTNDNTLYDLVNFEHPYAIILNEFDTLDVQHVIRLIFSLPMAFVRYVIVVHIENNKLDIYRPTTHIPVTTYNRISVVVSSKEEFVDLALNVSCYA